MKVTPPPFIGARIRIFLPGRVRYRAMPLPRHVAHQLAIHRRRRDDGHLHQGGECHRTHAAKQGRAAPPPAMRMPLGFVMSRHHTLNTSPAHHCADTQPR